MQRFIKTMILQLKISGTIALGLCCVLSFTVAPASAQTGAALKSYIEKVDRGETEEVKNALPELIAQYQNTAELLYLQGRLSTNGVEALRYYETLVNNFPRNDYADDALYRIIKYYQAMGLNRTANAKAELLRNNYPSSPLLAEIGGASVLTTRKSDSAYFTSDTLSLSTSVKKNDDADAHAVPSHEKSTPVFVIQVGAFSTSENAAKLKTFFEEKGYTAEIVNRVREKKSLFLVWVGSHRTQEEARAIARRIHEKLKIKGVVVERE